MARHVASAAFIAVSGLSTGVAAQEAAETAAPAVDLRQLVAPIALYPDEILSIMLPASTLPLQIVEAQRFLEKQATDPNVQADPDWDPSVVAMLNYPDLMKTLNDDLEWTQSLGDAVVEQPDALLDTIQQIRDETYDAGYLQTSDTVVVNQEGDNITIESSDPEVVYVPQYDPQPIIVQDYSAAPPIYYGNPYPNYYYPAAPFFTGLFFGAAVGFGMDWDDNDFDFDDDIDIDIDNDFDFDRNTNINRETRDRYQDRLNERSGQDGRWQPQDRPRSREGTRTDRASRADSARSGLAGARERGGRDAARPSTRPARDQGARAGDRQRQNDRMGQPSNRRQDVDRQRNQGDRSLNQGGSRERREGTRPSSRDRSSQVDRSQRNRPSSSNVQQRSRGGGSSMNQPSSRSRATTQSNRGRSSGASRSRSGGGGGAPRRSGGGRRR